MGQLTNPFLIYKEIASRAEVGICLKADHIFVYEQIIRGEQVG